MAISQLRVEEYDWDENAVSQCISFLNKNWDISDFEKVSNISTIPVFLNSLLNIS